MVTTIVPTHLVKRIGTGTIDQAEDPCPQSFAARRPTEERSRIICSAGVISSLHMPMALPLPPLFWHLNFVTCCWGLEFVETEPRTRGRIGVRGPLALVTSLNCRRNGSVETVVLLCLCEL